MRVAGFVLHLRRAEARRDNARLLVENCPVDTQMWDAVDGQRLSSGDLSKIIRQNLFDPRYPFDLKPGEVGCFLSHRQIWAEIIRQELDAAVVFEDDVLMDQTQFQTALNLAQTYLHAFDYIQFQTRPSKGRDSLIDRHGSAELRLPQITPLRTTAQLVSFDAAQTLLAHSETFDRPVDTYIQSHWITRLRAAMIYPSGISSMAEDSAGSTIEKPWQNFPDKAKREFARQQYRLLVRQFSKHSEAPVPDLESYGQPI